VPIVHEGGVGGGELSDRSGWIWKISFPTVFRKPDCLSRSETIHRLKYFEVKTDSYSRVIKRKNSKCNLGSSHFVLLLSMLVTNVKTQL